MTESISKEAEEKTAQDKKQTTNIAVLGGGCFWCTEAVFEKIEGVMDVVSGYAGGKSVNPTYKEICTGKSGHAEVIRITFNAEIISYRKILEIFGKCHDPTTLNRQGADVGTQYRSTIMYLNDQQLKAAEEWKKNLNDKLASPVVTEIVPAPVFYKAEEYHQDYYARNPNQGYCNFVIRPKLKKLNLE
ncbi:MAG: peptide-methionine (S)-S-oxide reductase MsrA [Verrucomicrobiota bacterium]|nr:peptide-methionine (S)-S-oxide reductase MsrA [Verrucomicrobiota bacterium]